MMTSSYWQSWWRVVKEVIGLFNCSNCGRRSKFCYQYLFLNLGFFFGHEYSLDNFLTPLSVYSVIYFWDSQIFTVIYITLSKSFLIYFYLKASCEMTVAVALVWQGDKSVWLQTSGSTFVHSKCKSTLLNSKHSL